MLGQEFAVTAQSCDRDSEIVSKCWKNQFEGQEEESIRWN